MAYAKECPECDGRSYSSCKKDWTCPYCGKDLTSIEVEKSV